MGFFDTFASTIKAQIDSVPNDINRQLGGVVGDFRRIGRNGLDGIWEVGNNPGTGEIPSNFRIDDFRTNLSAHSEVAKADKFDVWINIPTAIAQGTSMRELSLQCEAAELPGRDINMVEFRHYGFTKRIPHINQYGQVTLTFYCAGDMHEKKLFDRWMDIMVPTNSGLVTYPIDENGSSVYESDILINQYLPNGNEVYQVKLIEAVPTSVSPLIQNWSDDSIHRLTVTFAFKKWMSASTNINVPDMDFEVSNGLKPSDLQTQYSSDGINNYTNVTDSPILDRRVGDLTQATDGLNIDLPKLV